MVSWHDELTDEAQPLGLHFTIEADHRDGEMRDSPLSPNAGRYVTPPAKKPATAKELIAQLAAWFPEAAIDVDPGDPKLIHIAEKSLQDKSRGANPLDQPLSVKFTGTMDDFTDRLGELTNGSIAPEFESQGSVAGEQHLEWPITVDATNKTVRQIVTDYLPTRHTVPILWDATIDTEQGKPVASIFFFRETNTAATRPTTQQEGPQSARRCMTSLPRPMRRHSLPPRRTSREREWYLGWMPLRCLPTGARSRAGSRSSSFRVPLDAISSAGQMR